MASRCACCAALGSWLLAGRASGGGRGVRLMGRRSRASAAAVRRSRVASGLFGFQRSGLRRAPPASQPRRAAAGQRLRQHRQLCASHCCGESRAARCVRRSSSEAKTLYRRLRGACQHWAAAAWPGCQAATRRARPKKQRAKRASAQLRGSQSAPAAPGCGVGSGDLARCGFRAKSERGNQRRPSGARVGRRPGLPSVSLSGPGRRSATLRLRLDARVAGYASGHTLPPRRPERCELAS